jgi:predicted nucleotidyltransferase
MLQLSGDEMITREQIIRILGEQRTYLRNEYSVEKIGLFGSYGKGTAYASSDIDLVIEFALPIGFRFVELAEYLETLLGAPVDILTPAGLEGIRVPQVASEIQESVVYV